MKVAIYVEDGVTQIVLTPESKFEKSAVEMLHDPQQKMTLLKGEFYHCQGGWVRHGSTADSTMIRLDRVKQGGAP